MGFSLEQPRGVLGSPVLSPFLAINFGTKFMEIWKTHPYLDDIEVSSLGKVRRISNQHIFSPTLNYGYPRITTNKNYQKRSFYIHQLLAECFIGVVQGAEVNHIDGNRSNNSLENLEWVSHTENIRHALRTGLLVRKLTVRDVLEIRKLLALNFSVKAIAKQFNASQNTIYKIKSGEAWKSVT